MRTAAGFWCVVMLGCSPAIVAIAADDEDPVVSKAHQAEHFDPTHQSDIDVEKFVSVLSSFHAKVTSFIREASQREPPIAEPNRRDAEGRTLLHAAAFEGDVAMAGRLLASGADVELTLDNGVTPLMMAAFKREREIAQLLLDAGADVRRTTPRGTTALHYAAAGGDVPLVRSFLAAGAEIDARKPGGTTPLILAAQNGHAHAIDALVEAGADVNARLANQSITGLILAAQNGHPRAVSAMLRAGADSQQKDTAGRTALDYARANEHAAVVEILEKVAAELERDVEGEEKAPTPHKLLEP